MQKQAIFKIGDKEVYADVYNLSLDSLEKLKKSVAEIYAIAPDEIEVVFREVPEPKQLSRTTYATDEGLQYRADNGYAFFWQVSGIKDNFDLDTPGNLDKFLEALSTGDIDSILSFT